MRTCIILFQKTILCSLQLQLTFDKHLHPQSIRQSHQLSKHNQIHQSTIIMSSAPVQNQVNLHISPNHHRSAVSNTPTTGRPRHRQAPRQEHHRSFFLRRQRPQRQRRRDWQQRRPFPRGPQPHAGDRRAFVWRPRRPHQHDRQREQVQRHWWRYQRLSQSAWKYEIL